MKKVFLVFVLFAINLFGQKEELRGVWLTNVDSRVLASDGAIVEAVDYLESIGVNVIYPVVYNKGYTLYPSAIMDDLFNAPTINDVSFKERDFLERIVIEAHRVGIEVIPWFEFGFSSSYSLDGGHIVAKFPQWAAKNNQGQLVVKNGFDWLAGTNPEVQDYMLSLILEVIDRYDVDGIQGDDRLPAMPVEGGYDDYTVDLYKSEHGGQEPPNSYANAAWKKWRADKLSDFFQRMKDSVKTRDENLIVGVAPSAYPWGYDQYLQDTKTWINRDIPDNVIPQLYRYDINGFTATLNNSWGSIGQYIQDKYAAGVLMNVGTYTIDKTFLQQTLQAIRNKGAKGESFFFYEGLRKNNNELGDYLASSFYTEKATIPYRNGNEWRPKAQIMNEDSSVTTLIGDWEEYPMQGYTGKILRSDNMSDEVAAEYKFNVRNNAFYDVFTYRTPNTIWTENANYTLYSKHGEETVTIDQSDLQLNGWVKVGTVELEAGTQKVLRVDNANLENGKFLITDAVMLMINRKLSPDVVVSVEDEKKPVIIPQGYELFTNYPNPFNPETTLTFEVPERSNVRVAVYNVLGQEVSLLTNTIYNAGRHSIKFNAAELSSGVYLAKISAGEFSKSIKMMLLK